MESSVTAPEEFNFVINSDYVKTSYGKLFMRSIGNNTSPLFLLIHGSGPKNNSDYWENLLGEYLLKFQSDFPLYMVAIDCPGYGKSEGSKDTIRGFPLQFISEVIMLLKNEKSAFALMGSSQGGYSIFNAIIQNPNLAKFIIQEMPVCGDIKRLKGLLNPHLLIYDTEDDGHPVRQGKQIIKEIVNYEFITFNGKLEPYWAPDNTVDCIILFLHKFRKHLDNESHSEKISKIISTRGLDRKNYQPKRNSISVAKTKNINIKKETNIINPNNYKIVELINDDKSYIKLQIEENKRKNVDSKILINTNTRFHPEEKNLSAICSPKNDNEKLKLVNCEEIQDLNLDKLNIDPKLNSENQINNNKNIIALKERDVCLNPNVKDEELKSDVNIPDMIKCPLCYDIFWEPITLTCQHSFCFLCLEKALIYHSKCPYCRADVNQSERKKLMDKMNIDLNLSEKVKSVVSEEELNKRMKEAYRENISLTKAIRVEYGNYSELIKSKPLVNKNSAIAQKYKWKLYVKVINSCMPQPIKSVEFDINVGIKGSKPIIVANPPFELEKSGNLEFSCRIKINWKSQIKAEPYQVDHKVTLGQEVSSRQFLQNI